MDLVAATLKKLVSWAVAKRWNLRKTWGFAVDLIEWLPQGKHCQGRTPKQTFIDGKQLFARKNLNDLAA